MDASGNAYITGGTNQFGIATPGALQTIRQGGGGNAEHHAFVAKFNPTGSALVYSTYLGGTGDDVAYGIALDSLGNAYVAGSTISTNFHNPRCFSDLLSERTDSRLRDEVEPLRRRPGLLHIPGGDRRCF